MCNETMLACVLTLFFSLQTSDKKNVSQSLDGDTYSNEDEVGTMYLKS